MIVYGVAYAPCQANDLNAPRDASEYEFMPTKSPQRENEFELLRALAVAKPTSEQANRIASWDVSTTNWNEAIRLAEHLGVLPLVARNLIEHSQGLNPDVERSLRSAYENNLKRGLWFAAELARIIRHLNGQQLPVLPFKGPVLAQSVYKDPGLRSFSDLDLLISSIDFERAKHALSEIGYTPAKNFIPAVERFWLRKGYEQSFNGSAGKHMVELQWALLPYFYAVDLNVEDLLRRSSQTIVAGYQIQCLSPEDSVIVLSLHAAKHLWGRLVWLVDIAGTLQIENVDYGVVLSRARALGVTRILAVTFWLVKEVLHASIPDAAEKMIADDSRVPSLAQEFAARLARAATYDLASTEYFRLILKLRERRTDRLRYLWRLFWTPGEGDIAVLPLPEPLFPFYRVVRMGRLMRRMFSGRN